MLPSEARPSVFKNLSVDTEVDLKPVQRFRP